MSPDKVAQELCELRGVVNTEFGHITKRLDSHSDTLKQVGSDIAEIKSQFAAHMTTSQLKNEFAQERVTREANADARDAEHKASEKHDTEERVAEEARYQRRFWQRTWVQLIVAGIICLLSSMLGSYYGAHVLKIVAR